MNRKRMGVWVLLLSMLFSLFGEIPISDSSNLGMIYVKAADYNNYSNVKKSWFIKRNTDHKPSSGAMSAADLEQYRAFYYDSHAKENVMYLTFDCGYENGYTAKILDVLKKHDVKAVFFVTKHFVRSQPGLCKRMKEEGHLVGNHTMNHPSLPQKSVSQIQNEVKGLEEFFKEQTGYELDKFFRPPMGEYSNRVLKVVKDMGYTTVFWSLAYSDYDPAKQPGKQYVIDHFKKYYHKGGIALMHNISASNAEALDDVLSFLKKQNYNCMRIDACGKSSEVSLAVPQWAEYLYCDGRISPTYVELKFYADIDKKVKPDGFEIYRKEKGGSYQLLATKSASKYASGTYVDKTVKSGRTYYYKIRSYKDLYGKHYVSKYSESVRKTSVNQKAKYVINYFGFEPGISNEFVVKIRASGNNAISKFSPDVYRDELILSDQTIEIPLSLQAYSKDGIVWHKLTVRPEKFAVLKPSEVIYLKFFMDENDMANLSNDKKSNYQIRNLSLKYNGFYYYADLDLKEKNGQARIVGEYYH